eukprot:scaffold69367_cov90-Cyclotella_meneghiniana.AAC.5
MQAAMYPEPNEFHDHRGHLCHGDRAFLSADKTELSNTAAMMLPSKINKGAKPKRGRGGRARTKGLMWPSQPTDSNKRYQPGKWQTRLSSQTSSQIQWQFAKKNVAGEADEQQNGYDERVSVVKSAY